MTKCSARGLVSRQQLISERLRIQNTETEKRIRQQLGVVRDNKEIDNMPNGSPKKKIKRQKRISVLEEKLETVAEEVEKLKKREIDEAMFQDSVIFKHRKFCEKLLDQSTMNTVRGLLMRDLMQACAYAQEHSINLGNRSHYILNGLYNKLNNLNLFENMDTFTDKLKQFHEGFIEQKEKAGLTTQALSRIRCGYRFLLKYNESAMLLPAQFISDLLSSTKYVRNCVISYYKAIRQLDPTNFGRYPPLSKRIQGYETIGKAKLDPINLETVAAEVERLFSYDKVLATDLWCCVCLGYRRDDLLRISFIREGGEFARAISLKEKKNKHQSLRIIPMSLKRLITSTGAQYPITLPRFQAVRSFSMAHFRRFYGLRSLCITTITSALYQSSRLARFHRTASTTTKYYINDTNEKFINSAFTLPWLSCDVRQGDFILEFGQNDGQPKIEGLEGKVQTFDKLDLQLLELNQKDDELALAANEIQGLLLTKDQNTELEFVHIALNSYCVKKYNEQIQEGWFKSIVQVSSCCLKEERLSAVVNMALIDKQFQINFASTSYDINPESLDTLQVAKFFGLSQQGLVRFIFNLYRTPIICQEWRNNSLVACFEQTMGLEILPIRIFKVVTSYGLVYTCGEVKRSKTNKKISKLKRLGYLFSNRAKIGELQYNQQMAVLRYESDDQDDKQIQDPAPIRTENRKAKQEALSRIKKEAKKRQSNQLKIMEPVCSKCRGQLLLDVCKKTPHKHFQLQCTKCQQYIQHGCTEQGFKERNLDLMNSRLMQLTPTRELSSNIPQLQELILQPEQNKTRQVLEQQGYEYTNQLLYLKSMPLNIQCQYQVANDRLSRLILQNRMNEQRLPLQIRASSIKGAGFGVFATQDIPNQSLLCSYLGVVGTHWSISDNDSLYTLGWIDNKCILIDPGKICNLARFINTNKPSLNNCRPLIVIIKRNLLQMMSKERSKPRKPEFQVGVILYSTTDIKKGRQLFYAYGSLYQKNFNEEEQ